MNFIKKIIQRKLISFLFNLDKETKAELFLSYSKNAQLQNYLKFRNKYDIHPEFRFNGKDIMFYGEGIIKCGFNSYIGNFSSIQSAEKCSVIIGNNCSISHNVRIYSSTNITDQDLNNQNAKTKVHASVIIGNGVWIGANVFIGPGIHIGDNSIVGANSVVTKDVKSYSIVGGVPAKLIRMKNL